MSEKQKFDFYSLGKGEYDCAAKFLGDADEASVKKFADSVNGILCEDNIVIFKADVFDIKSYYFVGKFNLGKYFEANANNEELIAITKKLFSDFRYIKTDGKYRVYFETSEKSSVYFTPFENYKDFDEWTSDALDNVHHSYEGNYPDYDTSWIDNPSEWFTDGDELRWENCYIYVDEDEEDDTYDSDTKVLNDGYEHEFVKVEGGEYEIGSKNEDNNKPHKVKVDSFYVAKYQVTQELYESVIGENPSEFKGVLRPVDNVSWYDVVEFCNKLSEKEGLEPCYKIDKENKDPNNECDDDYDYIKWTVECDFTKNGYRLPTEAEWEIAAKGGENYKFAGSDDLDELGWYCENSNGKTHKVGQKKANGYGLFDMSGNVCEWCWDWYSKEIEGGENPLGASSGFCRVSRGGSSDSSTNISSVGRRFYYIPYSRDCGSGFRVCRSAQ